MILLSAVTFMAVLVTLPEARFAHMTFSRNKAPVSPVDQARLDGLNATANALIRVGTPAANLSDLMVEDIKTVENEYSRRILYKDGRAGLT